MMAEIYYDGKAGLLGEGGFGRAYSGKMLKTARVPAGDIALKRVRHVAAEASEKLYPLLRHEACALVLLKGHPSIPEVYAFGASQYYEYLAMQRLGDTLFSYFIEKPNGQLTLGNVVSIACQMLGVLEYVHAHGIVHCDISPSNIMFDRPGSSGRVYLIDFGLCRPYIDQSTKQHRPNEPMPCRLGNRLWRSLNGHRRNTPSRRDDLESLAYILIWLFRGGLLPWNGIEPEDIHPTKLRWSGAELCRSCCPPAFGEFLDYCRRLKYEQTPSYASWREKFAGLVPSFTADFNPEDTNGPFVRRAESIPREKTSGSDDGWDAFVGRWDYYKPWSEHFESVYSLSPKDLLSPNEAEVVMKGTERLSDVPKTNRMYLKKSCPREVLLPPYN